MSRSITYRLFSVRSVLILAGLTVGLALAPTGTAEAVGYRHGHPAVVYVPVQKVYAHPAPVVVRKVYVVHPAPVYRPSCH